MVAAALMAAGLGGGAAPAAAQSSAAALAGKGAERQQEYETSTYGQQLSQQSVDEFLGTLGTALTDQQRLFLLSICGTRTAACGGDVRLRDFEARGRGLSRPVLFTARNGGTVSGHVWATRAGPPKRPLVVITSGSIQASEQLYWWLAQTLAKAGYVVVTSDPAGQARSDLFGTGADLLEGFHSQVAGNTFYDGTQDALDFGLSTPAAPYCPRPSRGGTSHCGEQRARAAAGTNAAANPFGELVDPGRVGLAGHSYGAAGVSWVGQQDPRVDAVVGLDRLCDPSFAGSCLAGGTGGPVPLRVPALNVTADSFTGADTAGGPPADPDAKGDASRAYGAAGVDSGSIVIRGGTHFEFSYLPLEVFRATLRGIDLADWYALAWMDRYVKGDPTAERRLLSARWRADRREAAADAGGDGNLFSDWSRSRLDVGRAGGTRFACEDLRAGCPGQVADDGQDPDWGFLPIATAPDGTPAIRGGQDGPAAGAPRLRLRAARPRCGARACRLRLVVTNRGSADAARVLLRVRGARPARTRLGTVPAGAVRRVRVRTRARAVTVRLSAAGRTAVTRRVGLRRPATG